MTPSPIPYCGPAPLPSEIWLAWNFDPAALVALGMLAWRIHRKATGLLPAGASTPLASRQASRSGWIALGLLALIFISPLCALSSALFFARVVHHMLLVAVVAPLLVTAFATTRTPASTRTSAPIDRRIAPWVAFLLHVLAMWIWHAPAAYAWGLWTTSGYWLMQATLLGSAVLLWGRVLEREAPPVRSIALLLGTVAQMGLLGALIAFSPRALYVPHLLTTAPWGLDALADQQLGGLIMWGPALLPYVAIAAAMIWKLAAPTVVTR